MTSDLSWASFMRSSFSSGQTAKLSKGFLCEKSAGKSGLVYLSHCVEEETPVTLWGRRIDECVRVGAGVGVFVVRISVCVGLHESICVSMCVCVRVCVCLHVLMCSYPPLIL